MFGIAAGLRRPAVPAMVPVLAAIGALGVESLAVAAFRTLQIAGFYAFGTRLPPTVELVTVVGYALAMLFAFGSARWRGVVAAVALFGIVWGEQFWLGLSGRLIFCERSGIPCDVLALAWPDLWPKLLGIAIGVVAGRVVRHGAPGVVALALGVGLFALSASIGRIAFVPLLGANPVGEAVQGAINTITAVQLMGAVAGGFVVGFLAKRRIFAALVLVLYFIGPWWPQLLTFRDSPRPLILAIDWRLLTPVGYVLVAVLSLVVGAVVARYRATSIPTIP